MSRSLTILLTVVLLCSCAKPPHQELNAVEYLVAKAGSMNALEYAPSEYKASHTALSAAHRAMEKSDYEDARESLELALQHARRAVALAEEGHARRVAEEAAERARAEEQARLAEEAARKVEKTVRVEKKKPKVVIPAPKPKPKIQLVSEYRVGDGETLWTISAQPEVYNEGLLWPLLYQANRDQIKNPRQIFPGQSLSIRRDMTQAELEEARQKARESDIFPVPKGSKSGQ